MADGTTPRKSLADLTAETLAGKSLDWWRDKLKGYMRRAATAEKRVEAIEQELNEAVHDRGVARARVTELEAALAALTAERDEARARVTEIEAALAAVMTERDTAQAEATRLRQELESLDLDAVFDRMVQPWEHEIAQWEREIFG